MTTQTLSASAVNSTIVRFNNKALRHAALVRASFSLLDRIAPSLASRIAERLFFTAPRLRVSERERDLLASGWFTQFDSSVGPLPLWRWGEGRRVLLVHGWGGHGGQMTALIEPLVSAGFQVVIVDLPGHGHSQRQLASIQSFATAIEQVADALGGLDAVVAHSLGSAALTVAMSRGLRLRRAVLIAPFAELGAISGPFREALGLSGPAWGRFLRRAERRLGQPFHSFEPLPLVAGLRTPALVIHGDRDRQFDFAQGETLQRAWPGAQLYRAAERGHRSVLSDAQCLRVVRAFIAGV
jgi:pimeloyl-ACP methyl ester carboxylesterase